MIQVRMSFWLSAAAWMRDVIETFTLANDGDGGPQPVVGICGDGMVAGDGSYYGMVSAELCEKHSQALCRWIR